MLAYFGYDDVYKMLANLREELLSWLLFPTAAVALYAVLILNLLLNREPFANTTASFWIIGTCLLAYRVKTRQPRLAAYIYVFGVATAIFILIWELFAWVSPVLLPALILLAIAVLNTRSTLIVAVLATIVVWTAAEQQHQPIAAMIAPLTAIWLTFFVAWLSNLNRTTAVEWAWSSYCQAHQATEHAQQHRGELMRVYKALDEAYYRLERLSVQLARAREEAEEARRIKQQFVANVSHELRTPLNIIIGFSETIALSPEAYGVKAVPRPFMGDINRIYRSAQHLKSLIDDVLDLSQIDARHMPLLTEQSSLTQVITEATDLVESLAAQKGLRLIVQAPSSLPLLFLDRLRIRQVLLNLLSNAIRFTETGAITVSAQVQGREIQVTVADTGPGIAPDDLGKVFEEFQQLDASLSKRYEGTGLGLALSRRFVELHGGRMEVESELGRGSCFYFTLPLVAPARVGRSTAPTPLALSSHVEARVGRTVLLATEDSGTANLLKRHLHGYQVRSVSAEELPTAIETYLPHAVITQALGSTSAVDKEPALKPDWPVPVVACSLPNPHYLSRALGVDHYLVKPVTRERLLSLLADYGDAVKRVLIIDDDAQLAELLARIVRAGPRAYTVDITCGGEEGLAQMQAYRPDLVLLDLMMTRVDGLTVLQLMRANDQLRELPVVIITARDLPGSEVCLPGQSRIVVEGMENFTVTAGLNCVQAILDALPAPRPIASLQPKPVADQLHQPAS